MAVAAAMVVAAWGGAAGVATAGAPPFKDGDRICFIGDSITHQAMYHTQIHLFYSTRHPEMRIETWNCGIAGDTAAGAVKRYAWDIAPHKPTVASIMLGMNDVNRGLYADGMTGPDVEAKRRGAVASHVAGMGKLADLLTRDGTKIIFITPSLFDQTGSQATERLAGVNDALKECGAAARALAAKHGGGLVDFNGPMEAINRAGQAKDPAFTLVGVDRVHPGAVGHLVMAYLFLREQGMTAMVAGMEIDAARKAVLRQDNCEITGLAGTADSVTFRCLAKSLPFPVDSASGKALELVPFTEELNREVLRVVGLADGDYEVVIDGGPGIKTTAAALKGGVNLATVRETPQYRQALQVQALTTERAQLEGRKLRTFAQMEHLFFADLKERSPDIERTTMEQALVTMRGAENKWNRHRIGVIETYKAILPERAALERKSTELGAAIAAARRPVSHAFEVRRVRNNGTP
jgi:lysophospholipase L1-like esterase